MNNGSRLAGRSATSASSVSPLLDKDQQLLGYIASFQDLTEILRLEEEIRLKDCMAAVGRMAAGIAHEIRNPLTAMRGSVEILRSHANLPRKDERLLEILIRESDRLNAFIENFLNFAHPRKYARESLDLVPVLRDSVTLLRNSPGIRAKHSVVLASEARSIRILGSVDQLNQVFWNLAQNAIRAMPDGGVDDSVRKTPDGGGPSCLRTTSRNEPGGTGSVFQPSFKLRGGFGLGSRSSSRYEDHQCCTF
jgi:two-component system sensor histidine kinase PilS (NtrC family)